MWEIDRNIYMVTPELGVELNLRVAALAEFPNLCQREIDRTRAYDAQVAKDQQAIREAEWLRTKNALVNDRNRRWAPWVAVAVAGVSAVAAGFAVFGIMSL